METEYIQTILPCTHSSVPNYLWERPWKYPFILVLYISMVQILRNQHINLVMLGWLISWSLDNVNLLILMPEHIYVTCLNTNYNNEGPPKDLSINVCFVQSYTNQYKKKPLSTEQINIIWIS